MLGLENACQYPSIQTLQPAELDIVSGGDTGTTLAGTAGGLATIGGAIAPVAPPLGAFVLAVAATTLLVAVVAESTE